MKSNIRFFSLFVIPFIMISCNQGHDNSGAAASHDRMIAVLHPTDGNEASGVITFTREGDGVRVEADISGLDPDSRHGFHIHEYGDCSAPDGESAGGHYSPHEMPHGAPTDEERHMGDLGNLDSDQDGEATISYVDPVIELDGENTILGRAVVVHAEEDDLETQPTGDAGARLGCGVIGIARQ